MAKGEQYEARVEAWITPVLEQHQFELVDVEYVREVGVWYLRCYIDKEGGITVDDCEHFLRLCIFRSTWQKPYYFCFSCVFGRTSAARLTGAASDALSYFCCWHWQASSSMPVSAIIFR